MAARISINVQDAEVVRTEVLRAGIGAFGVVEFGGGTSSATVFCNTAQQARAFAQAFAEVADSLELAHLDTPALRAAVTGA